MKVFAAPSCNLIDRPIDDALIDSLLETVDTYLGEPCRQS